MSNTLHSLVLTFTTIHLGKRLICPFYRKRNTLRDFKWPRGQLNLIFSHFLQCFSLQCKKWLVQSYNHFSWFIHWMNQCNSFIVLDLGRYSLTATKSMLGVNEIMEYGLTRIIWKIPLSEAPTSNWF